MSRGTPRSHLKASFRLMEGDKVVLDEAGAEVLEALRGERSPEAAALHQTRPPREVKALIAKLGDLLGTEVMVRGPRGQRRLSPKVVKLLVEYRRRAGRAHMLVEAGDERPILTVDGLVLSRGQLVTIRRRYPPFEGQLCLPGGVVDAGETTEEAVVREIWEETGLKTRVEGLVGVYSRPDRDPRGHTVSVAYALSAIGGRMRAGDDAQGVALVPLRGPPALGFDHSIMVADYRRWRANRASAASDD